MGARVQQKNGDNPTWWNRPEWIYERKTPGNDLELAKLEMLESIRNMLEDIRQSQMMQCDVARAIKRMSDAVIRIDKRLAKVEKYRLRKTE